MLAKKILLGHISGVMLMLAAGYCSAAQTQTNDINAVEQATFSTETYQTARRGADDPPGTERPGDNHRQRRGGRVTEDVSDMVIARRGADDPVGSERPGEVHGQKRGGRNAVDFDIVARRGADDPVGSERPGEVHGQKRGGRA